MAVRESTGRGHLLPVIASGARHSALAGRLIGALLLAATAAIHARLYTTGYRDIPTIGPLFLLNSIAASLLCLGVLLVRGRWGRIVAVAGAGLEAGTLLGLVVAVTRGLFGFIDTTGAPLFWQSVVVEAVGTLVLGAVALHGSRG